MKTKTKNKLTLKDVVEAAHKAGCDLKISMEPNQPIRFPDDPECVRFLLDESERLNRKGNAWEHCQHPNPIAAEMSYKMGWAHALSAAMLRCYYKGELTVQPKSKP